MQQVADKRMGSRQAAQASRARLWVLALAPFLVLSLLHWPDGPGPGADDYGQYLLHAQALAEGRSYTDIGYLYSSLSNWIGPLAAPPGLPATLAPIFAVVGPSVAAAKLAMLVLATLFLLLAGRYLAERHGPLLGWGAVLLCGLSLDLVRNSTQVLSDLAFAAAVWGAIVVADRPGEWRAGRIVGITLLGALAIAYRVAGIALIPALLLLTVLRFRELGLRPAIPVAIWGLAALAAMPLLGIGPRAFLLLDPAEVLQWLWLWGWWPAKLRIYSSGVFDTHLYPFPWDLANDAYHLITAVVMLVGLAAWLRSSFRSLAVCFLAAYGLLLVLLPAAEARYVWLLYPLFAFGLLNGICILSRVLLAGRLPWRPAAVAFAFTIAIAPLAFATDLSTPRKLHAKDLPEVRELFDYFEERARRGPVRVSTTKPRSFTWETGIPAMGPLEGERETVMAEYSRMCITHVVAGAPDILLSDGESPVITLAEAVPDAFRLELSNARFRVYRYLPVHDAEACS